MSEDETKLTCLFGVAKLEPLKYELVESVEPRRGLMRRWPRRVWFIETKFARLGPFKSPEDAYEVAAMGGIRIEPRSAAS